MSLACLSLACLLFSTGLEPWLSGAAELQPLPDRQRFVAMLLATGVLILVLELVRRRKLRDEYSWVWIATSVLLIVLAAQHDLLITMSRWIGAASTVSTLFFGALVFLLALVLQFSVRLSRLTHRHRTLAQRVGLLEQELRQHRSNSGEATPTHPPEPAVEPRRRSDSDRDEVA